MALFPDIVALRKISGSTTIANIDAGATTTVTITLDSNYIVLGVPKVSTANASVTLKVINGGANEFTVEATNTDTVNPQTNVVVDYEVYVIEGV